MEQFFTDKDMLAKVGMWAFVCLGGMAERFDYSEAKALMKYWAEQRKLCRYCGGKAKDLNASEAKAWLEANGVTI